MVKECDKHKILNTETNRCVLRTGKIGRKILEKLKKEQAPPAKKLSISPRRISLPKKLPKSPPKISLPMPRPISPIKKKSPLKVLAGELTLLRNENLRLRKELKRCQEMCGYMMPVAGYISGISVVRLLKKKNKTICILGELHRPGECDRALNSISVVDYVDEIMRQQHVKVDLFVEMYKTDKTYTFKFENELDYIIGNSIDCIPPAKPTCKYGKNHVHWVDVRSEKLLKCFWNIYFPMKKLYDGKADVWVIAKTGKKKIEELLRCMHVDSVESIDKIHIYEYSKEISRANPTYKKNIAKYADEVKPYFVKSIRELYKLHTYGIDLVNAKDYAKWLYEALETFFYAIARMMDIYAIARMLKDNIQNIVYYAGSAHAKRTEAFLVNNGFKLVAAADQMPNNKLCVNMKNIPQPLFS